MNWSKTPLIQEINMGKEIHNNLKQISLWFAVTLQCLGNYTQELYTQENKEISMNIFTGLYSPN